MNRYLFLLFFSFLAGSCQFFDTEKVPAEIIYDEEIKAISWDEIDQYPTFPTCESHTDKAPQLKCFVAVLNTHITKAIADKKGVVQHAIYDTVVIDFGVSKNGKITGLSIKLDTITQQRIPSLESWLLESMKSLPSSGPAYKRGIPVATKFSLPIVIQTNSTTN